MGRSRVALVALAMAAATLATVLAVPPATASTSTASPVLVAQPVESTSPAATTAAPTMPDGQPAVRPDVDQRTGGSAPAPGRGRPGWVWWALAAVGIILVVGVLRLWRSAAD
jgi:hypothetical protein